MRLLAKYGFAIAIASLCSCSAKKINKSVDETRVSKELTSYNLDTSTIKSAYKKAVSIRYGDFLKGSINFDSTQTTDSIESNGVKVKATFTPLGDNRFKVGIEATAKPVENVTTIEGSQQTHFGQFSNTHAVADSSSFMKTKVKEVSGIKTGCFIFLLLLIVLLIAGYYLNKKYQLWKRIKALLNFP